MDDWKTTTQLCSAETEYGRIEYSVIESRSEDYPDIAQLIKIDNFPGESADIVFFPDNVDGYPFRVIEAI